MPRKKANARRQAQGKRIRIKTLPKIILLPVHLNDDGISVGRLRAVAVLEVRNSGSI